MAAQENHVEVVTYLLANGASQDITTEVYTSLLFCAVNLQFNTSIGQ